MRSRAGRSRLPLRRAAMVVAMLSIGLPCAARAQENYEIEVYPSATVSPDTLSLEIHSNYTFRGQAHYVDGVAPSYHAEHETVEATLGLTHWMELGAYAFTSEQPGLGANLVGTSIRPRVRIPDSWAWPVGLSLSTEIGYMRPLFSDETWSWEIRPIIDEYRGRWYVSLNPTIERVLKSPEVRHGLQFTPSAKLSYDVTQQISAGLEYYAAPGELGYIRQYDVDTVVVPTHPGHPALSRVPLRAQESEEGIPVPHGERQQVFAAADMHVSPLWEINFGVGFGTTTSADRLLAKLVVGRSFPLGSSSPMQ